MKSKRKKIVILIVFLFLVAAFGLIYAGIYFNNLAKPVNIYRKIINNSIDLVNDYLKTTNYYYNLGSFDIKSHVDLNVSSEEYSSKSLVDPSYVAKVNYLKNLSNMKIDVNLSQDAKNKKLLFQLNQKLGEENVLDYKYLIENATEYNLLNNLSKGYINNGSCNYFESLNKDVTLKDNIDYLRDFVVLAINENLDSELFKREVVEEDINGKSISVNKTSIEVDDNFLRNLFSEVLDDLKEDERSFKILNSIDSEFSKRKIKDKTMFLEEDEKYLVNVYSSKLFSNMLKLEVIYSSKDEKRVYVYEGNLSDGRLSCTVGDKLEYIFKINFNFKNGKLIIYNGLEKKIGTFLIDYSKDSSNFSFNYDDGVKKFDVVYSDKFDGNKKKFDNTKKLSFKISENKINKFNGNVTIESKVSNKVKIEENLDNSRLRTSLSLEEENVYKNIRNNIKSRLEK